MPLPSAQPTPSAKPGASPRRTWPITAAAVPLALLAVAAVRWGSRWGILLLLGPGLLLVPLGLEWAGNAGNADTTKDPAPQRPMAWSDLGGELLRPGWALTAVLLLLLALSVARSRRAGGTVADRPRQ